MTPENSLPVLTAHEKNILQLIVDLEGLVQGFPDTRRKLYNTARAWAEFASTEPYRLKFNPQVVEFMSAEEKAKFAWKDGIVPAEWLIGQVRKGCEWFPAPVVARKMYCDGGFDPVDGVTLDKLPSAGRRPARSEDE